MAATLKLDTITNASNATGNNNIELDAYSNVKINGATLSPAASASNTGNLALTGSLVMGSSFKRNRIINGDMRVDQRATAVTTDNSYSVDRWVFTKANDATESVAQNSDAPTGFSYSLRNTVSVADTSIGATQYSALQQQIEGYNIADLAFGTTNAKTITISFWIKSTVTGQYTACLLNADDTRVCPLGFTISASNTWEYKTITVAGCTDGTWNTTNGKGLRIMFWAALGSTYAGGTSGTWTSTGSIKYGVSNPVNALASNGNIFAITGVQLEVGSVATPYERQIYSDQLAQCQRYLPSAPPSDNYIGQAYSTTASFISISFPVTARVAPTGITTSGTYNLLGAAGGGITVTAITFNRAGINTGAVNANVASGLVGGNATFLLGPGGSGNILFTGCEL